MPGVEAMQVEKHFSIEHVQRAAWRALEPPNFPFFDFEFLRALENSGSVGGKSGWSPVYLLCKGGDCLLGALLPGPRPPLPRRAPAAEEHLTAPSA